MMTAGVRTHIARLQLTDFRNYEALSLDLEPGPVVLCGENGAGKTNLLEALSLLSPGRGLRRAPYEAVVREGAPGGFAVHARLAGPFGTCDIGTGTLGGGSGAEGGRRLRINGEPARSADALLEWLRVVWLVPAMDALFPGAAGDRRRFLDRLVLAIDPGHGRRVLDYEKAMRGRNRLLAESRDPDPAWLDAIEAQMAEAGVAIAAARRELVRLLSTIIERLPADGPFPRAGIELSGTIEAQLADRPAVEVEEDWRRSLGVARPRDRAAGRTTEGVHRCDMLVTHLPKQMPADLSSTGEQKALLAGIVLSHARLVSETSGMSPIMLMGEIAAHLDGERRAALFAILLDMDVQAFLTGTDATLFSALRGRAQFLAVTAGGRITPLTD